MVSSHREVFIGLGQQTSGLISAVPVNGASGGRTFEWQILDNNAGFFFIAGTQDNLSCQLRRAVGEVGVTNTCTIRCKVTDSEGNDTFTNNCAVTFATVATQDTIVSNSQVDSGLARAGIVFDPDGTLSFFQNNVLVPLAGQYLSDRPKSGAGNTIQVRCSAVNSGAFDAQAAPVGTWITIDLQRGWNCQAVSTHGGPSDNASVGATFQIRKLNTTSPVHTFTLSAFAFSGTEL